MNKSFFRIIVASLVALVLTASCGSKYNKLKFKDPNGENEEVYGDRENPEPRQLASPATPDPAVAAESKEITPKFREKVEQSVQK